MDGAGHFQAFVVSEAKGRWGTAAQAHGTAALNTGGSAIINEVACTSAGNCLAGGYFTDALDRTQPFVLAETRGHWGRARTVRGIGKLNAGGNSEILSVACAAAGYCTAVGYYAPALHQQAPMIVQERNGTWGAASRIPGLATLNKKDFADAASISCAAAGSCTTGGFYFDGANHQQAFVATELNNRWRSAIEIPGSGALNKGFDAYVYSVACASAGNCSAGGFYKDSTGKIQAFVVNQTARLRW